LKPSRRARIIPVFLLVLVLAASVCAAEVAVELLAETSLPGDLEVDQTLVGGLSGLTYDPGCDLFYVITDDRGGINPPRFYSLGIWLEGGEARARVLGATFLRRADGSPFPRGEIDPEALALHPDGSLFVVSEGIPHRSVSPLIGRFKLDGLIQGTLDLPQHYLPGDGDPRGVRDNLGFEGLAVSPDGNHLFIAAENALLQDGPAADLGVGSPTRLMVLSLADGHVIGEYLYQVAVVPDEPRPATAFRTNGISEILALDNHRVLVAERSFSAGVGNRVRLYLVDVRDASSINGFESTREVEDLDSVSLPKTLVADVGELGVEPDNIEGMALGPTLADGRRLLVLIADNNFQPSVQSNQVLLLAIAGVEPPTVVRPEAGIHEIQGTGHVSPLVGRCVSRVEGIVTAILGSRTGQAFWVQNAAPGDDDPRTSEGLFVTTVDGLPLVEVGDEVRLEGRVEERSWGLELPVTRLFATALSVAESNQELPSARVIGEGGMKIPQPEIASPRLEHSDATRFAADAFESLEGMLVRIEDPVVVGPTSRYGEIVVLTNRGRDAKQRTRRGGVRLLEHNLNPQRVVIDDRLVADSPQVVVGDELAGPADGVLHYSYGSYKLLNTKPLPVVRDGGLVREKTGLIGDDSNLTVATFNLENLSAVSDEREFSRLAAIVADHLRAPDIVAVQEVQDDTGPVDDGVVSSARTLELLVRAIEKAGGPRYEVRSIDPVDNADGGQPGANIRNAFLFNPVRVEFTDRRQCPRNSDTELEEGGSLTCSPGLVDPYHPAFGAREGERGGSRKPLVGEFRFAGEPLLVINLHLRSKGGDDPIFGWRQPRTETSRLRRTEQAWVVADFVAEVLQANAHARIVVLGDLNDFENTAPLRRLEAAGLEDLVRRIPLEGRYSYVYLGNSQVLDHILVSEALAAKAEVEMVHVNAEFPAGDRASDHDPVIARFSFDR
jgi:endonuclease/exonuclease/phosphatase family metal-dependent hydrolase